MMCLIMGLLTTVAIAWACAIWIDPSKGRTLWSAPSGIGEVWSFTMHRQPGAIVIWRTPVMFRLRDEILDAHRAHREAILPRWSAVQTSRPVVKADSRESWIEQARGWPCVTMKCDAQSSIAPPNMASSPPGGIPLLGALFQKLEVSPLALRPIWPDFAGAVVMWAMAWAILLVAPNAARRLMRRRRGACLCCGYDLRRIPDSPRCPECGIART